MIDDAIASNLEDPDLIFKWKCPDEINVNCTLKTDRVLKLSFEEYSGLKKNIQNVNEYTAIFTLFLMKGKRESKKDIKVTILKPLYGQSKNETATQTFKNYADLILILPKLRGFKNEDLIFETKFLDETIDKLNFIYYWTVETMKDTEQYLNGRKEDVLRLRNNDIPPGDSIFILEFYEKDNPTVKYVKKYTYHKEQPPFGGNCEANPSRGFSLETEITFSANRWQSTNQPLSFNFYMTNFAGWNVSLTDDMLPMTEYTTSIIPVGNDFFLDVVDSTGLKTTSPCPLVIEKYTSPNNKNKKQLVLTDMLERIDNPKLKLLLIEAFTSNDFSLDSTGLEASATILNNLVNTNNSTTVAKSINKNIDIILSQLNSISAFKGSQSPSVKEMIDKVMINVTQNLGSIVQDHVKVDGMFKIINNNYENLKFEDNPKEEIMKNQNYILQVQLQLFTNMVTSQNAVFSNNNFISQVGKFSQINHPSYSIIDDSSFSIEAGEKVRRILFQNGDECMPGAAVCLPTEVIKNISAQVGGELGIVSQINKKVENNPISEESFSKTSLNMNFVQNDGTLRLLENLDLDLSYTTRLRGPNLNNSRIRTQINDTACVQYDRTLASDAKSCTTWYDYDKMDIICKCSKPGLIVNVFHKTLSSLSKLAQFPVLTKETLNVYSLSIVCSLFLLQLIFLCIGHYRDHIDEKKKKYMISENFDMKQYFIIRYTKEGFDKNYSLWKLYCFVIKTNHPILSIISIFSETYYRKLRVLDFFLKLYIAFFFTFLSLYVSENDVKKEFERSRNFKNMNARVDELGVTIEQMINGIIYSVVSNVFSTIVILPLSFIIYSDVLKEESEKRKSTMQNTVRSFITRKKPYYSGKVIKGIIKLKSLFIINSGQKHNLSFSGKEMSVQRRLNTSGISSNYIFLPIGKNEYQKINEHDTILKSPTHLLSETKYSQKFIRDDLLRPKSIFSEPDVDIIMNNSSFIERRAESFELSKNSHCHKKKVVTSSIKEGERKYLFHFPKDSKFTVSCSYYKYCPVLNYSNRRTILRKILSQIKFFIIIGLDILIWYYLLFFTVGIYNNYGKQIIQLCILPLIFVFVIKIVFISCFQLFMATVLMFYFGPMIYPKKALSIKKILFNLIVPPIASSHHQAILLFFSILRRTDKKLNIKELSFKQEG